MNKSFYYRLAWFLIALGGIVTLFFLINIGQNGWTFCGASEINIEKTGAFGDYIGGFVGTIFSLAGFIFLFLTLREQREAFQKERFENKLFEFIRIHRENVQEIRKREGHKFAANEKNGRSVFKLIYSDIEKCIKYTRLFFKNISENDIYEERYLLEIKNTLKEVGNDIDLISLAKINIPYCIVFYGVDFGGKSALEKLFSGKIKQEFYKPILDYIALMPVLDSKYFTKWEKIRNFTPFEKKMKIVQGCLAKRRAVEMDWSNFDPYERQVVTDNWYKNNYIKYFGGNQYRLGHYFRHLYLTIKYINDENTIDDATKYIYAKTLRAQLSTYEQIIFYFNSLSFLGMAWELTPKYTKSSKSQLNLRIIKDSKLISKYKLIKNIPFDDVLGFKISKFYPAIKLETDET